MEQHSSRITRATHERGSAGFFTLLVFLAILAGAVMSLAYIASDSGAQVDQLDVSDIETGPLPLAPE